MTKGSGGHPGFIQQCLVPNKSSISSLLTARCGALITGLLAKSHGIQLTNLHCEAVEDSGCRTADRGRGVATLTLENLENLEKV